MVDGHGEHADREGRGGRQVAVDGDVLGVEAVIQQPLTVRVHATDSLGITRVEMLNLEKDCVIIRKDPDEDGNWATSSSSAGSSGGPANACSKSTRNRSRFSKT